MWARGRFASKVDFLCISVAGRQTAQRFQNELNFQKIILAYCDRDTPRFGQLGCSGFVVLHGDGTVVSAKTPAYLSEGEQAFRFLETLLTKLCSQLDPFYWPADLNSKSVGEIKRIAHDTGVDVRNCVEKKEFVDAIVTHLLAKQSAGKLKKLLREAGIDTSGCLEREEFVQKVIAHKPNRNVEEEVPVMPPCGSGDGVSQNEPVQKRSKIDDSKSEPEKMVEETFFTLANPASVGNVLMDREHEECTAAVNKLWTGRTLEQLKTVLYTFQEHFEDEEELMKQKKFGGPSDSPFSAAVSHAADHNQILARIQDIVNRIASKNVSAGETKLVTATEVKLVASLFDQHAHKFDLLYSGHL